MAEENIAKLKSIIRARENGGGIEVIADIATGGMGKVLLGKDIIIDRKIAFKVLHEDMENDKDLCRQFINEAKITGLLEHSNIVPLHTLGVNNEGLLYFTMKFVNGDSLLQVIEHISAGNKEYFNYYTQFMRLSIFRKVCDAVAFAHSKNIVHRDIKPENIMIGDYGEVLLMDWGIAKFMDEDQKAHSFEGTGLAAPTQTLDGVIKGSPAYMSPEQARGDIGEYDYRSEVFLLGATLYHLMTLQAPYHDSDVNVIVNKAEKVDFVPPGQAAPKEQIPEELCCIIQRAMHEDKDQRYQRVEDLIQAIDNLMSGQIMSTKLYYKAGEDIIRYGEDGHEAYVIVEGEVEVYKKFGGKKTVFMHLKTGDTFGEMSSITNTVRSASVKAVTDTTCLIITPQILTEQLRKVPPWLEKIITNLSDRLRSMDNLAHPLMVSDCTFEVSNQLKMLVLCYGVMDENNHLCYDLAEAIYEIANNLKIPQERARPIIAGLAEAELIEIDNSPNIIIPNWNLFCDFVGFCKDSHRLSATSTKNLTTIGTHKMYTDGKSVIHRHSRLSPNERMPPLKTMKPLKDQMSGEESRKFRQEFMERFQQVVDYASESESLSQSTFNQWTMREVFSPLQAPTISTKFTNG